MKNYLVHGLKVMVNSERALNVIIRCNSKQV